MLHLWSGGPKNHPNRVKIPASNDAKLYKMIPSILSQKYWFLEINAGSTNNFYSLVAKWCFKRWFRNISQNLEKSYIGSIFNLMLENIDFKETNEYNIWGRDFFRNREFMIFQLSKLSRIQTIIDINCPK